MAYTVFVIAASLAWFFYSLSAQHSPGLMIASGVLLLVLLIPLVKRPAKRQ